MEVMIQRIDNHSIQPATGEETQFHRCFGIQREAQHGLVLVRFLVDPVNLVEDGIGLRYLFQRTTFFTRFRL